MLNLILAPAALIALAPTPAVQGPVVEGLVLNQAGKPLPASVGLIPMFQRDEPFPVKTVENLTVKGKKKTPGFQLPIPAPGLYILDIRGRGSLPFQVPVLLDENGLKGLEISPIPDKPQGEVKPFSPDANIVKRAAIYAAQRERDITYRKAVKARFELKAAGTFESGPVVDWTTDLESLAADLRDETDPDIQSLVAACYLDLGSKMARLDPEMAALALDKLPATSPWWAFSPRSAGAAFAASNRSADWNAFREALSRDNPDSEVRAYGYYSQAASAFNKGDKEKFDALYGTLTTDYKTTKYAKSAKTFDPTKMPAPSSAVPTDVPPMPPPTAEVPPAPTPAAPAPIPIENPIQAPPAQEPPAPEPSTQASPAQAPPAQEPPAPEPSTQASPAQAPPVQEPPVLEPPTQEPTAQVPLVQEPPTQAPPAQAPTQAPLVQELPAQVPPTHAPPVQELPVQP